MSNQVELSVKSQLRQIIEDLEKISAASENVGEGLQKAAEKVDENLNRQVKGTERYMNNLRSLSARIGEQVASDFRSLVSLNAISGALKISEQFKGGLKETLNLNDAIRKLGGTFGVAARDFAAFQARMTRGLGDVGLSSEVAVHSMEGLADTPVRGEKSLLAYSKTAGELASLSRESGKEGDISKGIANVITARGGNANDMGQMRAVAEDLRRVFNQTGKGPTETLQTMEQLFRGMSQDFRKTMSTRTLANLAASGQVAGPNATKFLEQYLSLSKIQRSALAAQGVGNVIGANGQLNTDAIARLYSEAKGRGQGDARMGIKTIIGGDDEAAEGFLRLAESLNKVKAAQAGIAQQTGSVDDQYRQTMGAGEAFRASINRIKSDLATPLSWATQKGTNLLSKASQSDAGALGVVAGGGLLAAVLAGGGTRGLGKGLLGGALGSVAKGAAAEQFLGQKTIPVYVVNAGEMGGGGIGGLAGGAAGALGKAGLFGGAAALGVGGGMLLDKGYQKLTENSSAVKGFDDKIQGLFDKLYMAMHPGLQVQGVEHKVKVELNKRELKESKPLTRGATF